MRSTCSRPAWRRRRDILPSSHECLKRSRENQRDTSVGVRVLPTAASRQRRSVPVDGVGGTPASHLRDLERPQTVGAGIGRMGYVVQTDEHDAPLSEASDPGIATEAVERGDGKSRFGIRCDAQCDTSGTRTPAWKNDRASPESASAPGSSPGIGLQIEHDLISVESQQGDVAGGRQAVVSIGDIARR